MTTSKLQRIVIERFMSIGHKIAIENTFVYHDWECDVFTINNWGETFEFEVKTSRSDFLADFNKEKKHYDTQYGKGANYFTYVAPEGIIKNQDVPDYAGLLIVDSRGWVHDRVTSPMLHKDRITPEVWEKIALKLFWKHTKFGR